MKTITRVKKIIEGYENKPDIQIMDNGGREEIWLNGGHWSARQDVEDYYESCGLLDSVSNSVNGKRIMLTVKGAELC